MVETKPWYAFMTPPSPAGEAPEAMSDLARVSPPQRGATIALLRPRSRSGSRQPVVIGAATVSNPDRLSLSILRLIGRNCVNWLPGLNDVDGFIMTG